MGWVSDGYQGRSPFDVAVSLSEDDKGVSLIHSSARIGPPPKQDDGPMRVGRGLLGVVAGHFVGLVGRRDECAAELPGVVAAHLEAVILAFDDHGVARDVIVWPLCAVNLDNDVVVVVVAFDNPR